MKEREHTLLRIPVIWLSWVPLPPSCEWSFSLRFQTPKHVVIMAVMIESWEGGHTQWSYCIHGLLDNLHDLHDCQNPILCMLSSSKAGNWFLDRPFGLTESEDLYYPRRKLTSRSLENYYQFQIGDTSSIIFHWLFFHWHLSFPVVNTSSLVDQSILDFPHTFISSPSHFPLFLLPPKV